MSSQIGVRELRRDLSAYLRRVQKGESFDVTSRGRTVASLGPPRGVRDPLIERLVRERGATPARLDPRTLPGPLTLDDGGLPMGEILREQRADRI